MCELEREREREKQGEMKKEEGRKGEREEETDFFDWWITYKTYPRRTTDAQLDR